MTTKAAIEDFYAQKVLAVAGVSRDPKKFGNAIYRDLKAKGYTVYPINPNAQTIEGDPCYPNLSALPAQVAGLVIATPPAQTEQIVREAAGLGIRRIWLQQGSESPAALKICQENKIDTISGECIFMYSEPTNWMHKAHRWVNTMIGKKPA